MEIQSHREGDEQRNRIYKYFGMANKTNTDKPEDRFIYVKNLLKTGEVYFNNPRDFNDLFDSLIDYSFVGKEIDIAKWFCGLFDSNDVDEEIKDRFRKILQSEEVNKYAYAVVELEKYYKEYRDYEGDQIIARVCCFADSWNVSPMWGHYASSNKGICVGLEVNYDPYREGSDYLALDFKEPAPNGSGITQYPLFPIIYAETRPEPFEIFSQDEKYKIQRIREFLLTKHSTWQYEQERRILSVPEVGQTNSPEILHLKRNVIKEVIFGYRMSEEDREMLTSCLEGRGVELYQIELPKNSFQLSRKRL